MRMLWWLIVGYEAAVGVAELVSSTDSGGSNTTVVTLAGLPSVASLATSSGLAASTGGIIDLAIALGVWYFALR